MTGSYEFVTNFDLAMKQLLEKKPEAAIYRNVDKYLPIIRALAASYGVTKSERNTEELVRVCCTMLRDKIPSQGQTT